MTFLLLSGFVYAYEGVHDLYPQASASSAKEYGDKIWRSWRKNTQGDLSPVEQQLVNQFQEWARKGDAEAFSDFLLQTQKVREGKMITCSEGFKEVSFSEKTPQPVCVRPQILLETDNLKNNLLHSARDISTLTAVGSLFRSFFPEDFLIINHLKNEKNLAQETPLVSHVSRGELATFWQLYSTSKLSENITHMERVLHNPSNLVRESSFPIYKQEIVRWGTDASGMNIGQLVGQLPQSDEQTRIMHFFKQHAPYLFD